VIELEKYCNLNPKRGFIIEKFQPITKKDINLIKTILDENDEVVIGIGNAGYSHEKTQVMTAGERIELSDHCLRAEGIPSEKYILIPIENSLEATRWVAETLMITPKWDTIYTRNFKNASMFQSFQRSYRYEIKTVEEQKSEKDYFDMMANYLKGDKNSLDELKIYIADSTLKYMSDLGIFERVNTIYNRKRPDFSKSKKSSRTLFLGGFQPFTGVFSDDNGHFSNIKNGLENSSQMIIAVGSAQDDHKPSDPFTAGQRIDIIRHTLISNGIGADKFYTIPIKNIDANACFAPKVISLCPQFDKIIAGNDWTKQLFGQGDYKIIPVNRTAIKDSGEQISATKVRKTITDIIKDRHSKEDNLSDETISIIEKECALMLDKHTLDKMRQLNAYTIMHFLAYAKE
jgi:nicotinamide-nucleotide adenylyltransferase